MSPVMVCHLAVVLLDSDDEADQSFIFKSFQAKEVHKHEQGLSNFVHIVHIESVECKATTKFVLYVHVVAL